MNKVGLFGGTFDPVHIGHLRLAVELQNLLDLSEMRLLPCATPPHRSTPISSGSHRLAMLRLAVAGIEGLRVDDRELHRAGLSYSIDTLQQVREELGQETPLFFCIGMDSLVNLASWHRWRELHEYANIVVVARPGWRQPHVGVVADWVMEHQAADLETFQKSISGKVFIAGMTLLPISSTAIRDDLRRGLSVRFLVPDKVIDYIHAHRLYSEAG